MKELYNELIQKEIDALTKEKSNGTRKHNILNNLENVGTIFTALYLHYKDVSKETLLERNIADRIKLRKERFDEIKRKEKKINKGLFKAYFADYQSPSSMYKKLSETGNTEINKTRVDVIKKVLTKLKRILENSSKNDAVKTEENEKITDIIKRILEFNYKIQSGQRLKILTPNQMLRLPISLAQLKAGNNSEIRQLLYSLYR